MTKLDEKLEEYKKARESLSGLRVEARAAASARAEAEARCKELERMQARVRKQLLELGREIPALVHADVSGLTGAPPSSFAAEDEPAGAVAE